MPILTDTQKATLAARLAESDCAGLSDQAACDLLNAQGAPVDNPDPPPMVAVPAPPLDPFALMAMLSSASLDKLESAGMIAKIDDVIHQGDIVALSGWLKYAAQRQKVTADEAAAVQAALASRAATTPVPDPNWPAKVHAPSWANTWAPGVEFTMPGGSSVINHVVPAMISEARS